MTKYDFTSYALKRPDSSKWASMYSIAPDVTEGIVPLSVADMEFKAPPILATRLGEYVKTANFGYYKPQESYYEAVISFMNDRHGLKIEKEDIHTTNGVVNALHKAVNNLTSPGGKIIIFTPVYYPFYGAISANGRTIVESPLIYENNCYTIDFTDFAEKAKDAQALILCNPHNPVGRVWTKEELTKIASIAEENALLIISDDIHLDFVSKGYSHTFIASVSEYAKNNTVTCTAPSKSFNLAALQCSNIIIQNKALGEKFEGRQSGLTPFAYIACECVYNECRDWLDECCEIIRKNAEYISEYFKANIPEAVIAPLEGTYLMWINFAFLGLSGKELDELMKKNGLFLDGGEMFGAAGENWQRVNLAEPEKVIRDACVRFSKAVSK